MGLLQVPIDCLASRQTYEQIAVEG